MQHVGAMGVEYALGISRCSGRVAHAGGGVFVERPPFEIAVDLADPLLIGHGVPSGVEGIWAASVRTT